MRTARYWCSTWATVRIADVAAELISQSGREIDVVYTGLREGEKLHEDLLAEGECDVRPHHPRISQVPVPPLDPEADLCLDQWRVDPTAIDLLSHVEVSSSHVGVSTRGDA